MKDNCRPYCKLVLVYDYDLESESPRGDDYGMMEDEDE